MLLGIGDKPNNVAVDYGYRGNGAVLAFEEDGILKILDEYNCPESLGRSGQFRCLFSLLFVAGKEQTFTIRSRARRSLIYMGNNMTFSTFAISLCYKILIFL
jgi:hypothetical protein